ncbi:MarR family winged helix-turn-helix transcriptional regulator [Rhodanobacter ginsengisoli]|uniref:MarR family winged helix-turn-helix transcriptional regulator n=1 Tax=Rhodanobacter ginsengisoli TaxID=418646 RepID=A0ABW0QLP1_9GAMM
MNRRDAIGSDDEVVRHALIAVERLHRALWHSVGRELAADDLSVVQWLLVSEVARGEGRTLTHFARATSRDAGSLSRAIHQLTQRGLLENRRSHADRRSSMISLTSAGRAMYRRLAPRIERIAQAMDLGTEAAQLDRIAMALAHAASRIGCGQRGAPATSSRKDIFT